MFQSETGIANNNASKAIKKSKPVTDGQKAPENLTGTDMKQNTDVDKNPDHGTDPHKGVIEHPIDLQCDEDGDLGVNCNTDKSRDFNDQLPAKKKMKMDMFDIAAESENVVFDEDGDLILERHVAAFECMGNIQELRETGGDTCVSMPGMSSMSSCCTCSCGDQKSKSSDEHFKGIERSLSSLPVGVSYDNSGSHCYISAGKKHPDKDTLNVSTLSDVNTQATNVSNVSVGGTIQSDCKFQESCSDTNIQGTNVSEDKILGTSCVAVYEDTNKHVKNIKPEVFYLNISNYDSSSSC